VRDMSPEPQQESTEPARPLPVTAACEPLVAEANETPQGAGGSGAAEDSRAAALQDTERLLRVVANNATLGLFIMDERQQCVYMNPAAEALTGYHLEETRGRPLHDVLHHTRPDGSRYPLEDCPIDRAFPAGNQEQGTENFVHKDGSFYPVAFTASPIRDEITGQTIGTIIEVRGIADELEREAERDRLLAAEREARQKADHANRAKSEFLAAMSHELRTPLNAISGYVQLLQLEIHGPVTSHQGGALQRIESAQRHLLGLINDVLNYTRLEAGRVSYDIAPIDLAELAAETLRMVEPQLGARGLVSEPRYPSERLPALGDRDKVCQILLNLLSNAVKFTASGGRIRVEVHSADHGRQVAVLVSDNGVGIPPEQQERIFDPFVQVNRSLTQSTDGVGLGLAISRDLARAMSGELCVSSRPREGSTFTLTLPAAR
jgi:PAS domain S-box-containing protein